MTMLDATAAPFDADARAFVLLKSRACSRLAVRHVAIPNAGLWTQGGQCAVALSSDRDSARVPAEPRHRPLCQKKTERSSHRGAAISGLLTFTESS